MKYLSEKIE